VAKNSGRLQNKADAEAAARRALTSPTLNLKNLPTKRKPRKKAPPEKRGISEQFRADDTFAGNHAVSSPPFELRLSSLLAHAVLSLLAK